MTLMNLGARKISERTHCPYCAFQCGMLLDKKTPLSIKGDETFPVNRGQLCIKGWTSGSLIDTDERIKKPLVRDSAGNMRTASWEAALDAMAEGLASTKRKKGACSVGVFGSGALTNEKAYLLGKFARVALQTANIDYNGRYCMASAAAGQNIAFGLDRGLPFPVSDIALTDAALLFGSNSADTMPPIMQWFEELKAKGGFLIVADPRRTPTAKTADLHLQLVPGSDLALANGLLHVAIVDRLIDMEYVEARTSGFDAVRQTVLNCLPAHTERITGVPAADIRRTAHALAEASSSMLLSGRGSEQQSKGTDTVLAFTNFMLAIGKVGKPASGYGCLTGQGNGQGGREHGQKADQLPGYRSIMDSSDREMIARIWQVAPDEIPGKGLSAFEMLDSIGDPTGISALLVVGSNVAVASPNMTRIAERLQQLDFLGVLDAIPNETTAKADVVLPVTMWAEEDGTTTNLEGRVIRRRKTLEPPSGVKSDIEVLCALAARLGNPSGFIFNNPEEVFAELARATAGARADYSGITYEKIDHLDGVFWPCPSPEHPGTARLFADRFHHSDGRAKFVPVVHRPAGEEPDDEFPIYLTTGRYKEHYNSGAQTRRVERLTEAKPEACIHIHPLLAERTGLKAGAKALVESRRGTAMFSTVLDPDIRANTVFAPFHWGDRSGVNRLTNTALDPTSRMPEFKICAVRLLAAP